MTRHKGDPAFQVLKSVNKSTEPDGQPIPAETVTNTAIQSDEKDEQVQEYSTIEFQLSQVPSLVENESFYVNLLQSCYFPTR